MQRRASSWYGAGKSRGRTDIETSPAGAAMVLFRRVRRQIERGEDRAEEQPGAVLARNQVGVLALPAQPGRFRQRLLHHRRRVDKDFDIAAGLLDQPASQRLEPRLDDLVIVVALGINRDRAAHALVQDRERIAGRAVIDAQQDDRLGIGHSARGSPRRSAFLAIQSMSPWMPAARNCRSRSRRARDGIGPRDAERVEAERASLFGERALGRGRRQKSRLA